MRTAAMRVVSITLLLLFGTLTLPAWADPAPSPKPADPASATRVLQGELLKIEGEFYVVKDTTGKEVRVRVDKDTVFDARIKIGDKVDAQVSPDGRVTTMLRAS